jgi:hypothetical protein
MKNLTTMLEQKRTELVKLQAQIELLEQLVVEKAPPVQESPAPSVPKETKPVAARKRPRSKLSVPDAVEAVLTKEGKPLHAKDLVEKMRAMGVETSTARVATALQRFVKAGERFERPAPNTYGLKA